MEREMQKAETTGAFSGPSLNSAADSAVFLLPVTLSYGGFLENLRVIVKCQPLAVVAVHDTDPMHKSLP